MSRLNRVLSIVLGLIVAVSIVNCGGSAGPTSSRPVVTVGPDQVADEGQALDFAGSFSDADTTDTHTYVWDFGDGNSDASTLTPSHAYIEDGTYMVSLTVTDSNGRAGADTLSVLVSNVFPTVDAGGDQDADKDELLNFAGSYSDPGASDTHTYLWDFEDGSTDSSTLTPSHAFTTDGSYTVTLTVTDDDGGVGSDTLQVNINKLAPTVTVGNNQTVDEGSSVSLGGPYRLDRFSRF